MPLYLVLEISVDLGLYHLPQDNSIVDAKEVKHGQQTLIIDQVSLPITFVSKTVILHIEDAIGDLENVNIRINDDKYQSIRELVNKGTKELSFNYRENEDIFFTSALPKGGWIHLRWFSTAPEFWKPPTMD